MSYLSDFIGIDIQGDEELAAQLDKLPAEVLDTVVPETLGYLKNVFQTYPSYKYVSRKSAYGVTFFTKKQRRWFFAALRDGRLKIPYRRTQTMRKGWRVIGDNRNAILVNETPYADLLMGEHQSRHAAKIGWKQLPAILKERREGIQKTIDGAVKKAFKKLGLT